MPKRYQHQIDEAFHIARDRVDQAAQMSWPQSARTLARAAEHGMSGLLIAWGAPRNPAPAKVRAAFDALLRTHLDDRLNAAADSLWHAEQLATPPPGAEHLARITTELTDQLRLLADAPPPPTWAPPPPSVPITWDELDEGTRALLLKARDTATTHSPQVRLLLTGSRAAGKDLPGSDFDILMIFPQLDGREVGQAVGHVNSLDRNIDVVEIDQQTWTEPDPSFELLVDLRRQCHIEVPATGKALP
ncbi:nucleotidyltransferase domain-containing protein [Kitasatospora cineracea]|uniref:nucleotidyltransferase domain-containing protein n=1 Tax=Kitasatospora cineracea TaxID=88074 RepID=UPI0036DA2B34